MSASAKMDAGMTWLTDHGGSAFDLLRAVLEGAFDGLLAGLLLLPFWVVGIVTGLLAARNLGWKSGLAAGLGMALCQAIGLWPQTIETLWSAVRSGHCRRCDLSRPHLAKGFGITRIGGGQITFGDPLAPKGAAFFAARMSSRNPVLVATAIRSF